MKKLIIGLIAAGFLSGCASTPPNLTEDLFQYKDSYVGDSGAVGNITRTLTKPDAEQLDGLELKTTEEPYGIQLNYAPLEINEGSVTDYEELSLYNAGIILALIDNADWVQFKYVEEDIKITRDELEKWYGKELRKFENEEELRTFLQEHLADEEKVSKFFE
ncbi:DUF4825 domain-containing protein [Bacillus salacetis]|uniref:DUF4825 domain-containing protein n=1 Tax=Bacillus salacetis TaxID=2315464 RepID=A0A3A1QZR1_9BACI|nr:DUF4825 domain-containing protein [Bacillus salacetis]RIW34620.1 DUF4825 domain-containing protein [Bacillus salacetis]